MQILLIAMRPVFARILLMGNHRDEVVALLSLSDSEAARLSGSDADFQTVLGELRVHHEGTNLSEIVRRPLADGRSILRVLLEEGVSEAQWAIRYDGFAHAGPFDAFSPTGQIDPLRLSCELGIPLSVLANAFGTTRERLIEHPQGKLEQWKATELLGALNQLAEYTTEKRYALWWLRTPQPEIGGLTPLEIMNEGRLDLVIRHISNIYFMVPD
jgi:hypothetical protein